MYTNLPGVPLSKPLYTLSYMFVTAGASGFLLTIFFYIVSLILMYCYHIEVLISRLCTIGLLLFRSMFVCVCVCISLSLS